ncbi:unnamed protein product [Peniophora sp. CBMAI 1063]|nr:unnamed protein product [Peniophora sp. CBMAI 1063]
MPTMPTLYFRDGILSVPGYAFEKAVPWEDTGSFTQLAEGSSLKDGSPVLAKIVPAHTNASVMLEREAHILNLLQVSREGLGAAIRPIDMFKLPRGSGDCTVLLLVHPGPNQLGHYFPRSINPLLLSETTPAARPVSRGGLQTDIFLSDEDMETFFEDSESTPDTMDLATFLEFAIQATHCLDVLHGCGVVHREIRANAFHVNSHSGVVRLVHMGNRHASLETFGAPSSLVCRSDNFEEVERQRMKEALCYLPPEQTGSIETTLEDARTDLYALGILFWSLIVGRGTLPFEGGPLEMLHACVHHKPVPVHEVRRDSVPLVLSQIVEKLLAKSADHRYQSAYGLKVDLLECQRRLLAAVSSASEQSMDLIPQFEIGRHDRYSNFTMPSLLVGREKELDTLRAIIRNTTAEYSHYTASATGAISLTPTGSQASSKESTPDALDDEDDSKSSRSDNAMFVDASEDLHTTHSFRSGSLRSSSPPPSGSPLTVASDGIRRMALHTRRRGPRTHGVLIVGPPGAGKSSLVLAMQPVWRAQGLWGHAKFQEKSVAPFEALMTCLSSALRQLMAFSNDLHRFITSLKTKLGPHARNIPLLYTSAPELRDILELFDIGTHQQQESLPIEELRVRFQSLVEIVFSVLAETRPLALFLDDVQEADPSSIDLITTLTNLKTPLLIFITVRDDKPDVIDRVHSMFSLLRTSRLRLDPLPFQAVSTLCARVLRQSKESVAPLARLIHAAGGGNAFAMRSVIVSLHRQKLFVYDGDKNAWRYDLAAVESALTSQQVPGDPSDITYLRSHLRELPDDARTYIIWASFFGSAFKATDVSLVMDKDDSSGSQSEEDETDWDPRRTSKSDGMSRASVNGLQTAIAEGWVIQRGREMCSFTHDAYRQAAEREADELPDGFVARMSFRILMIMLAEPVPDIFQIAKHTQKCLPLLRRHQKRSELLNLLIAAGEAAQERGAHEQAYQSYLTAQMLLDSDMWTSNIKRTLSLYLRLAELALWRGDLQDAQEYISDCLPRAEEPIDKATVLKLRSQCHWQNDRADASMKDVVLALEALGIDLDFSQDPDEVNTMFEQVKNEVLAAGFDAILSMPRCQDEKIDLAVNLLGDAGIGSYWQSRAVMTDVAGLMIIRLALRHGMSPGTGLGFLFVLQASAETRELYRFSSDLGKMALRISDRFGSNSEKCRSLVMFSAVVSAYDNAHIRANNPRLQLAADYALSAGDRVYGALASMYAIQTRFFTAEHLDELLAAAEESYAKINVWAAKGHVAVFSMSLLCCVRAFAGATINTSAATIFDTTLFSESEFIVELQTSDFSAMALAWHYSYKVAALYCLGYISEAVELGFTVYEMRKALPNHRSSRFALFFHCLALVECIREGAMSEGVKKRYLDQAHKNMSYLRKWLSPSPVNNSTWIALIDAELSSLDGTPETYKLFDTAVKLAVNNDFLLEEGLALFLQGSYFVRNGVDGLGTELQRRGLARQSQWGALGLVARFSSIICAKPQELLKRHIFTADVGIQTDNSVSGIQADAGLSYEDVEPLRSEEDEVRALSAPQLAAVLRWSKEISRHIQLFSALQRLTEIAVEASGAQSASIVIIGGGGEYAVATSMEPPAHCQIFENMPSIRTIEDPLQRAVLEHCLSVKERVATNDAGADSRFSLAAKGSTHRSVVALPIYGNRGQTFGAIALASKYSFAQAQVALLTLLCQQANVSISNALLFRSVQSGTRENLKMISSQREALEAARQSRAAAEQATKIKSNFLASMSHELRTPFSSFYGLLDLLSSTELQPGQREIVQTAQESCSHLLKVINSILDYSKLEAGGVRQLEYTGFAVEAVVADCIELLAPTAAKNGLDLSYNIDPSVPAWVLADYERVRQIIMNLVGNAVKFTASGSVKVYCSVDKDALKTVSDTSDKSVYLKFTVKDTGIGLSQADVGVLFQPFSQADNSTTRKYGGTGLGLSICRELVKLMNGVIGVRSELGKGSDFWFTIPVREYVSEDSRSAAKKVEDIRTLLLRDRPPTVVVCSPSDATHALLTNMLRGFRVTCLALTESLAQLVSRGSLPMTVIDFIIYDYQDVSLLVDALRTPPLRGAKVIHLCTPVSDKSTGRPLVRNDIENLVRLPKPARTTKLFETMAGLVKISPDSYGAPAAGSSTRARDEPAPERTLYGNVLIAEDNPIAQGLLIKQLTGLGLVVVPTSNGEEAIAQWSAHEPGYFALALFDHHMPVCDGVEAAKRLRVLESRRKIPKELLLPIVALSADAQDSTKRLCLSAGMNDFLSKPLRRPDLNALLSSYGSGPIPVPGISVTEVT